MTETVEKLKNNIIVDKAGSGLILVKLRNLF